MSESKGFIDLLKSDGLSGGLGYVNENRKMSGFVGFGVAGFIKKFQEEGLWSAIKGFISWGLMGAAAGWVSNRIYSADAMEKRAEQKANTEKTAETKVENKTLNNKTKNDVELAQRAADEIEKPENVIEKVEEVDPSKEVVSTTVPGTKDVLKETAALGGGGAN